MVIRNLIFIVLLLQSPTVAAKDIGYDPLADPFKQLKEASIQAKNEDKYVLVISGGDWCHWCHVLDDYLNANQLVYEKLTDTFVVMKVYFGEKNYNKAFFAKLPESNVAPHFWILNSDNEILLSQYTHVFQKGRSKYKDEVFITFIEAIEDFKNKRQPPREFANGES